MYLTISLQMPGGGYATLVPRIAVQSIGERSVVYVPPEGEEGRFTERTVKIGRTVGESVEVLRGRQTWRPSRDAKGAFCSVRRPRARERARSRFCCAPYLSAAAAPRLT